MSPSSPINIEEIKIPEENQTQIEEDHNLAFAIAAEEKENLNLKNKSQIGRANKDQGKNHKKKTKCEII